MSDRSSDAANQMRDTSSPKARMRRQSNGRQQTIEILPVFVLYIYICFNKVYKYKYCLE